MRMARFAHTPPGCSFREPQGPKDSVTLSGASSAERPAHVASPGWKAGLFLGLSLVGLMGVGTAHAAPPAPKPQTQSQAHQAGQQVNKHVVKPIIETGKDLGEAGKQVGQVGKKVGQEIGKAGKEFGQEVGKQGKAFGLGVRDFFKGAVGK